MEDNGTLLSPRAKRLKRVFTAIIMIVVLISCLVIIAAWFLFSGVGQ